MLVFKKGDRNSKDNYRLVSILPNMSKIFEQSIFRQLYSFVLEFLSKCQCSFDKGYGAQHCMLAMLEKWKSVVDKRKSFGALLTDLSKAVDCLPHEFLFAKLHAYGFSIVVLRLIRSYLTNRKQRTKVNLLYSPWEEILLVVPQGSILGPLLLNIFLYDLFLMMNETDFASYVDDNMPYKTANTIGEVNH